MINIYIMDQRFLPFYLAFALSAFSQTLAQPPADLFWSMDDVNGVDLFPNVGNRTRWRAQLNVSDYRAVFFQNFTSNDTAAIVDGLKGDALLLDNFNLQVGVPFNTGCLFDIALCGMEGITVTAWIFVRRWTDRIAFMFASSDWALDEPGIAFYEDSSDRTSFKVSAITVNGSLYFAAFNRDWIGQKWSHVAMTWSFRNGIKLYVNGSEVPSYTQGPAVESRGEVISPVPHLEFGADFSDLILDEVGVWYRELSEDDIFILSCPPNTSTTTASPATSTFSLDIIFTWRTETVVAVTLGIVIALSVVLASLCVFCCLLCGKRRRRKKKTKKKTESTSDNHSFIET